jgi:hypothetical protein
MRTFIPQGVDAITTDDEFANLENYSRRRGIYQYQFRIRIDQIRVLKLKASKLRITLKRITRRRRRRTFGDGALSPDQAIQALLVDKPATKDSIRSKRRHIIQRRYVDLSSKISNDVARYVDKYSEEDAITLLPTRYTYVFRTAGELKESQEDTGYTNVVFRGENFHDVEGVDVSQMAYEAVNKFNKDPARLVMQRDKIVTQSDSMHGTIPAKEREEDIYRSKVIRTLRRDITTISNATSLSDLDDDELVPVREKSHRRFVTVKRRFNLRRKQLKNANGFLVVLELMDKEGGILQRETVRVPHRDMIKDYFIPRKAPYLRHTRSVLGKNTLVVYQRSKKADGFLLYKRVLNDSMPLMESKWTMVKSANLRKRGRRRRKYPRRRVIDVAPNTNPVIYRVIPKRGKNVYPIFKSVVVPAVTLPGELKVTKNKFSAMSLKTVDKNVEIQVRKYDKNASFMAIMRKDLTAREKDYRLLSKELEGDGSAWRLINSEKVMTFVDKSVQDERVYEYKTKLLYKDGTEMILIGGTHITHMDETDEVAFTVSKPRISRNKRGGNCTFKIIVNLETEGGSTNQTEILNDFLQKSGTRSSFSSAEEKQELTDDSRKIVVFSIERHNLTTGHREMFDVFNPAAGTTFNDGRESRKAGLKKRLNPGNSYRYIVRAHRVSPSDLFKHAAVGKIDRRTGRKYRVRTAKSTSRAALRRGTLLPPKSRRRRPESRMGAFNIGKTGSMKSLDINFSNTLPEVTSGGVEKISDMENILTWNVSGDPSFIDHFIIIIERFGSSIPVFVAQGIPRVSSYEYVDTYTPRMRGPIEFKIIPVYLDFTRGEPQELGAIISSGLARRRRRRRR